MPNHGGWYALIVATLIVAIASGFAVGIQWLATGDLLSGIGLAEEGELIMSLTLWLFVWACLAILWLLVTWCFSCSTTMGKANSYALFMAFFAPWAVFGSIIVSRKWDTVSTEAQIFVYFSSIAAIALSYIGVGAALSYPVLRDHSGYQRLDDEPLTAQPLLPERVASRKFR